MRIVRTLVIVAALVAGGSLLGAVPARAAERGTIDPQLTNAIVADRALQAHCGGCIRKVEWLGASYPRLTVDAAAWRRAGKADRTALARGALAAASRVYLQEWAAGDIYQRVFVIDRSGAELMTFQL